MKFVLVAGASGYLGRHLVAELKRQGHRVRALVRQREPLWKRSEELAPAVGADVDEIVVADLTQPASLRGVCHGIQAIVSAAGLSSADIGRLSPDQVDYHGNRNLLIEAINAGSVDKFIYVSSLPRNGSSLEYVVAKEKFVKDLQESVMTSYIVRPTLYYNTLLPLLYAARQGAIWLPGDGNRKVNPLHGRDLAQVCIKGLIAKEKEISVGGPEVYSLSELTQLMYRVQNKQPNLKQVPGALTGLARQSLRLMSKAQRQAYDLLESDAFDTGVAPAQGSQKLADYLKAFIESPFFRPS